MALRALALLLLSLLFFLSSTFWPFCSVHASPPSPFDLDMLMGQKAPEFSVKDIHGNLVSISSLKGNVILLNFWATWCPPCVSEMPSMDRLYQSFRHKGLTVIGVSMDGSVSAVKSFIKKNPVSFIVIVDSKQAISRSYKAFMTPLTFIIDKRGIVIDKYFGEQDWTDSGIVKKIESFL